MVKHLSNLPESPLYMSKGLTRTPPSPTMWTSRPLPSTPLNLKVSISIVYSNIFNTISNTAIFHNFELEGLQNVQCAMVSESIKGIHHCLTFSKQLLHFSFSTWLVILSLSLLVLWGINRQSSFGKGHSRQKNTELWTLVDNIII